MNVLTWCEVDLALVWATVIEPSLGWPRQLEGLLRGKVLAFVLAGALVTPMTGQGFMGRKSGTFRFAATNLLMHAAWGLVVGTLYVPR